MLNLSRPFVFSLYLSGFLFLVVAVVNTPAEIQPAAPAVAVYSWQRPIEGNWQSPSNWMPARKMPASTDILIFNIGGTLTVTDVPTQTIGQIFVLTNTNLNLQSQSAVALTIEGGEGDDFTIAGDSSLNLFGLNAISINLQGGAVGDIDGSMAFASSASAAHRLTAVDVDAITFNDAAVFTAGAGFTGNPFGTTNLNSVIFDSGSTYISIAGGDPFGAAEPNSVTVFKTGSLFSLHGTVTPSFSGRTYANFEMNYPTADVIATGSSPLVMDDLTITAGKLDFLLTGDPGHSIKGNVFTAPGTRLSFNSGTIHIDGSKSQAISRHGEQGASGASTVIIDNPRGVFVDNGVAFWNLQLTNGVITVTDPTWYVSVAGTVTRTNGYVNGFLKRIMFAPGSFIFDVGTEIGYSPVTADLTFTEFAYLSIRANQGAQPNIFDPSKTLLRYWTIFGPTGSLTADLTFYYLDADVPVTANEQNFAIQKYDGAAFSQQFGVVKTAANTFRVNGVTDFYRDWTLAEPGAVFTATATATPTNTTTSTPTNTPTETPTGTPSASAAFDYDGDRKTDISVFRQSDGAWYLQRSQAGFYGANFGLSTDKITPVDFDGDGKTDIAVYRPSDGIWYVLNSGDGTVSYYVFGLSDDLPVPADYDGDGKADVSVFRPSTGTWYRQNSGNGTFFGIQFGADEDKPIVGDFDGDRKSDIAVFRPSTGAWYQIYSMDGSIHGENFGFGTDVLVPADYDGDGKMDVAVFRPSDGYWYARNSSDGVFTYHIFGLATDVPAPGDFDGDGKEDINVFRPSDGTWYRQNSSNGAFVATPFGTNGDKPTMTAFRY